MSKTKCIKDFECEICHNLGMLQILSENSMRVRHYIGIDSITKKSKFSYCKQTPEYVNRILEKLSNNPDQIDHCNHDQNLKESSSFNQNECSGRSLAWLGHQPPTLTTRVQIPATAPKKPTLIECMPFCSIVGLYCWNFDSIYIWSRAK